MFHDTTEVDRSKLEPLDPVVDEYDHLLVRSERVRDSVGHSRQAAVLLPFHFDRHHVRAVISGE